jgi:hypothetical protein
LQNEEELIENLLKAVWHAREDTGRSGLEPDALPEFARNRNSESGVRNEVSAGESLEFGIGNSE